VAAARDRPGGADIWLLEVERGVTSRFTLNPINSAYPLWSPDQGTIVFSVGPQFNLFRKGSGGAGKEERLTQSPSGQYAQTGRATGGS